MSDDGKSHKSKKESAADDLDFDMGMGMNKEEKEEIMNKLTSL